jgi:hypothetical protein
MEFFPIKIRLFGGERYVLWFQDDIDGVVIEDTRRVLTFNDRESLTAYANERHLLLSNDTPTELDLDWIAQGNDFITGQLDCAKTLNAWNFFSDVASSLPEKAIDFIAKDKKPNETYDKLFWGNNLPAVTPEGEHYTPEWSREEIVEIESILVAGLMLVTENAPSPA